MTVAVILSKSKSKSNYVLGLDYPGTKFTTKYIPCFNAKLISDKFILFLITKITFLPYFFTLKMCVLKMGGATLHP